MGVFSSVRPEAESKNGNLKEALAQPRVPGSRTGEC